MVVSSGKSQTSTEGIAIAADKMGSTPVPSTPKEDYVIEVTHCAKCRKRVIKFDDIPGTPLEKAIFLFNNSTTDFTKQLSKLSGKPLAMQNISKWINRGTPPKWCVWIEKLTNGAVTARELRPDIFVK